MDLLWGESPPRTAATSLQNFISQLRKAVGADVVITKTPGYPLKLRRVRSTSLASSSSWPSSPARAGGARGPSSAKRSNCGAARRSPISPSSRSPRPRSPGSRSFACAVEERIEADLDRGGAAELVGELEALAQENPLRERLRGPADARALPLGPPGGGASGLPGARSMLVDELGIEPTPALQQLHASILRQESALQPQAVPGRVDASARSCVRLLSGRLVLVLGPAPSERTASLAAGCRAFDCPEEHRGRPDARLAVRGGHSGRRAAVRPAARACGRQDRPASNGSSPDSLSSRARGSNDQLLVTTGYGDALEGAFEQRGEEVDIVSFVAPARTGGSSCTGRRTGRRRSWRFRTATPSSPWRSGR